MTSFAGTVPRQKIKITNPKIRFVYDDETNYKPAQMAVPVMYCCPNDRLHRL
jgi:hypothetical protein